MNKKHGAEKIAMWAAHSPLFSRAEGVWDNNTGVDADGNLIDDEGNLVDSSGKYIGGTGSAPVHGKGVDDEGNFVNPNGTYINTATSNAATAAANKLATGVTPPAAPPTGLLADFAKQTSTVAGLQNLLTQATTAGTTIAKQIAPLTNKGKKNAPTTPDTSDKGGGNTKDKSKTPPTKILGMSVPVFGVVAFLVVGGIVVGGLYAAGVIGGGSSSATTVPLVPNLVSKAA